MSRAGKQPRILEIIATDSDPRDPKLQEIVDRLRELRRRRWREPS